MVINRREIKRKHKDNSGTTNNVLESPKRTKVHAQRKFAQGSNVSSPVLTPVKEIERQERLKTDVIPEPQELVPMNRPHTEDFLTFLCFRGTSMLPPKLSFFNAAPIDSSLSTQPSKAEPISVCQPIASITTRSANERPFIAFGVRKRADPVLVSKHMDKKRRHALALQALRRKYQEQKMAKIRAVTISKLSERITSKSVVRTRSVTKNETTTTKKNLTPNTRVKIITTKHVKVTTRSAIKTPLRTTLKAPIRTQIQKRMCLRSFRGRFIQQELQIKKHKKKATKLIKKMQTTKKKESSSEFSSDDDQPLKTFKVGKPTAKKPLKKSPEIRVTRASHPIVTREQTIKRKIHIAKSGLQTKSPFVKLTPPKHLPPKHKAQLTEENSVKKTDRQPERECKRKEPEPIKKPKKLTAKAEEVPKPVEPVKKQSPPPKVAEEAKIKAKVSIEKKTKPKIPQRPTRKTKEAAAIYMEILGHKLVNEDDFDDDSDSIDSFPELPNVRKTEQRENELKAIAKSKKVGPVKRATRSSTLNKPILDISFSDSDESVIEVRPKKKRLKSVAPRKIVSDTESEPCSKKSKDKGKTSERSFSDSDEEPLAKLKPKAKVEEAPKPEPTGEAPAPSGKPKRECTKRPQNYLSLFSSSEDEEKLFHGFLKGKGKLPAAAAATTATTTTPSSADLLCKDVDKRFGKGKVNMSTEQIEKWIKDSALAGGAVKKETDDILQFEEKPKVEPKSEVKSEPPKPPERKAIFRKEKKALVPNVNAFSANNESSIYAFEADNEESISTPFRRPSRRPSSTATSHSEEESLKGDDKGKFLVPPTLKTDTTPKTNKEVSLMLSTDDANNIAVQLDINSADVTEASTAEDGEQLFYIPLQPGKQSQLIQGVAVKLGTKGVNGPNQRVVMSAKLVTHTPLGAQKLVEKPLATSTPMYPPATIVQKGRESKRTADEEPKYKVPSSPSASSSSSTAKMQNTKRQCVKSRTRPELCAPIAGKDFPSAQSAAALLEAPIFHPNEKEFQDPLEYIEKIRGRAEKFGICRIVPPSTFKPECKVSDDMRFTAYNQYVHKMLHRWGPNFKELMAITKYLETQNITLTHPPWIGGIEIDLPRLYQVVQSLGGLKEVIEKKKWSKVSELMRIPKSAQDKVTKLDDIYCKYLLPYDTLSPAEREKLFDEVETEWAKRESKGLLQSQQKVDREASATGSESDSDDEAEECIVKGRSMALNAFYRIARNTMSMWFKTAEPTAQEVEQEFWKHVTHKQSHICVHSGSIDSGNWGYGFAVSKNSPFARHAWNLKVLTNNSTSVLRSMGPVMGVTVPTLHVGMVFSACCWYRDPHSLPWIEYLHTGGKKIWYGIPDSMSKVFRTALIKLVPNYCRNKSLWLPSDTAMVPPSLLVENGVSLCRTIQEPGQFIVVFPKAFTSSLCTGYVVSESVYFAPLSWLSSAEGVFEELQKSCEPSMFSLDRLLVSIASDVRSNVDVLRQIIPAIESLSRKEQTAWGKLEGLGLKEKEKLPLPEASLRKRKKMHNDGGDYECEVCCKNLFVSWVIDDQEDAVYCLSHAEEALEKDKLSAKHCKLYYTYCEEDLTNLINKMKVNIEQKMQKKAIGKSTASVSAS